MNLPHFSLALKPLQAVIAALLLGASALHTAHAEPIAAANVAIPGRTPVSRDRLATSNYGMSIFVYLKQGLGHLSQSPGPVFLEADRLRHR